MVLEVGGDEFDGLSKGGRARNTTISSMKSHPHKFHLGRDLLLFTIYFLFCLFIYGPIPGTQNVGAERCCGSAAGIF